MPPLCPVCRKVHLPGKCDVMNRFSFMEIKEDFFGPSAGIFVGRKGYPNVFAGPLASADYNPLQEDPSKWFGMDYASIIRLRSSVIRSKKKQGIFSSSRFVADNQLLSMASKPVDVELNFTKKPFQKISFSEVHQPMGPSGNLKQMRIADNVKIDVHVEKALSDDIKAGEASFNIYAKGTDVYKITSILSSGVMGIKKKMVPTRWSITAVDDIITKRMLEKVRESRELGDHLVFESFYMDNRFIILMMPGAWEYENFEAGGGILLEEYEPFSGRTSYAEKEGGGYYAARLGVVEWLFKSRKQARVVVFREIGEKYTIPLGVWQVRENVRNAMKSMKKFGTMEEALDYAEHKLKIPLKEYRKHSIILKQSRLTNFT